MVADLHRLRRAEEAGRSAHAAAEQTLARLDIEARTLVKLTAPAAGVCGPRLIDHVTVSPGFEAALAAALGDDLDASLDSRASVHWRETAAPDGGPPLPDG
ncbi:hypothetical protein J8J27_23510, partial [Mycobacterium tuberculosis]|nr:hypothetical protein [Mycobacterium tuberculosis]